MMYFSGKTAQFMARPDLYGCMFSYRKTGGQDAALVDGCLWMLDNGAFSGNFDADRWAQQLADLSVYRETCRGIVMPDAVILNDSGEFVRGDWRGTLDRLYQYLPDVIRHGLPVAYAVQDDHPIAAIPWDDIDVLFIAGRDDWKESIKVEVIAREARCRNKRVHIGRVSSLRRLAITWFADSWDGTTFIWDAPDKHRLIDPWLESVDSVHHQWRLI